MNFLGKRSRSKLAHVHPDLIVVVCRAIEITEVDFSVLEGIRTKKRQKELMKAGASWTMKSRHIPSTSKANPTLGHAVDLGAYVNGAIRWDWSLYYEIADAMRTASEELRIPVKWGGDWSTPDGPHFQLPWGKYK